MRNHIGLSSVAFAVLTLAANTPAGAVSLNIGGQGGLVSVDSGTSGSDTASSSSGGGVSVGIGGRDRLLDLGGDADADTSIDVDLGLGRSGKGFVDLDTGGDDGIVVDLFGEKGAIADAELGLSRENRVLEIGGDDALVSLFGPAGGSIADVDLGEDDLLDVNGAGSVADVDLFSGPGSEAAIAVDLFGPGADDDVDGTSTGSVTPAPGDNTGEGDGNDGPSTGPATTPQPVRPVPVRPAAASGRVATLTTGSTACFSPDDGQIAHLLDRNSYGASVTAKLAEAETVKLVPINLCADAEGRLAAALAADDNIGALQAAVAADAEVSAALAPEYQPSDVLAADQSGDDLTVFVY